MDEYYFPGLTQHASEITMLASSVSISNPTSVPTLDSQSAYRGSGQLSSEFPSALTTVEGVPVSAQVLVRYRAAVPGGRGDGLLVASTTSSPAGEWSVRNLNSSLRFDVSARYPGENDALQSNVVPFDEPRFVPSTIDIPVGVPLNTALPVIGGTGSVGVVYVSGAYPLGVSLVSGRLQGSWPTGVVGTYPITYELTDDVDTYTRTLDLNLYLLDLAISPPSIGSVWVEGVPITPVVVSATGGEGPYTYAVTAGSLPGGLTLNGSSGEISGTPTTSGAYSFDITATDVRSATASKTYSGEVAVFDAHKYWRVYVTAAAGGHGSMVELEFLDDLVVRCDLTGGAPIQSSNYPGFEAYRAFDGVTSGDSSWAANSPSPPMWLGYEHATAVAVSSVRITARTSYPGQAPNDFIVQSSDDGVSWTDEWSVTGSTGWGANEQRTFPRP